MSKKSEPQKSKIPYVFFAFFAVIFAVNIFYIYLSNKSWRGIASQDSYQKGLHYNQTLKQAQKQKELGWKIIIKFQPIAEKNSQKNSARKIILVIDLQDNKSQKISDAEVEVEFKRPIQEGFDFKQKLKFVDGFYQSEVTLPLRGQWDFAVLATKNEDSFQEVKRYVIQ